ncbi:hypothetical protein D3C87_2033570 [compost metagenome]
MRAFVEVLDDAALKQDAKQQHDRNGDDDRGGHGVIDQHSAEIAEPRLHQRRAHFERLAPG